MKVFGYEISKAEDKQLQDTNEKHFNFRLRRAINSLIDDITVDDELLYNMYRQNPDIRSAIRKKALYIGANGIALKDEDGEIVEETDAKDEYDLMMHMLNNPTFMDTKVEFSKHLDVSGERYLVPTTSVDGKINGFQVLHPKTVDHIYKEGQLVGFKQVSSKGTTTKSFTRARPGMSKKEMVNSIFYYQLEKHTNNEHKGMGLLEGVVYDVLSDLKAQEGNYYSLVNEFGIPGLLKVDKDMSKEAKEALVEQLEARHQGAQNRGKPLLAQGVKGWESMQLSPKDMEQVAQRKITTEKVCSALQVPKSILNYTDKVNYNTSLNERREFLEGTINNYQDIFTYVINSWLDLYMPDFGYKLSLNKHEVEDNIEQSKVLLSELQNGTITINEYRTLKKRPELEDENADKALVSKNMIMLEDVALDPVFNNENT